MKRNLLKIIIKYVVFLCALKGTDLSAQQRKETDSLLKVAVMEVYNNPARSIAISSKIYKAASSDNKLKIKSLLAMAQANIMLAQYEDVVENAEEALRIAKEINDYNDQIVINNFLGNHYFRLELKDKAWNSLKISEALLAKHPPADSLVHLKGNVYLLKGYLYADKLDCNYATIYFDKAIACFEKSKDKDFSKINLGVVYTHKGRCLLDNGKLAEAEECFRKAVAISAENNNIGVNVFSRLSLSQVYAKQKHFGQSTALLLETLKVAQTSKQLELVKEIYKQLSENYLATNDIKKHSYYKKLYDSSLKNFDQSETKSVDEIANKVSEKNKAAGKDKSSNPLWIILLCTGLVLVILVVYFRIFKLKKQLKKQEGTAASDD